mmetsp:Transcript_29715/g.96822  ORF Transcript_29715/g.96822 Transcript_29715/m.96822 type:complete len:890 (+) Transcript_29715:59-2728(+)
MPVLWFRGQGSSQDEIIAHGFYPKFENDERAMANSDPEAWVNVVSCRFFRKWSGFLSLLLAWRHPTTGAVEWTATSKNSAAWTGEFVRDAARLWAPHVSDALLTWLADEKCSIGAEMLSKRDQSHGAAVLRETPMVTCVARGLASASDAAIAPDSPLIKCSPLAEVVNTCQRFSLPVDEAVAVEGAERAQAFLLSLEQQRDQLTETSFRALLGEHQLPTRSLHAQVLGDVLEGLVLHLTLANGSHSTVKYKLPNYTSRTFGLRAAMGTFTREGLCSRDALTHFEDFTRRWCISAAGRHRWLGFLCNAALLSKSFKPDTDAEDTDFSELPRYHIQLADTQVARERSAEAPGAEEAIRLFKAELDGRPQVTVCVVLGPIGYGKSTCAAALCEAVGCDRCVHIDGDELGVGEETTMRLKGERGVFSMWRVVEALARGRTPVMSTGGGVLFATRNDERRPTLRSILMRATGADVRLVVFVPGDELALDGDPAFEAYDDGAAVEDSIRWRLEQGLWALPPGRTPASFAAEIAAKSGKNRVFAQNAASQASRVITYPRAAKTATSGGGVAAMAQALREAFGGDQGVAETLMSSSSLAAEPLPVLYAQQERLLALPDDPVLPAGHITLRHASNCAKPLPLFLLPSEWAALPAASLDAARVAWKPRGVSIICKIDGMGRRHHVTLSNGPHPASVMGSLAEAYAATRPIRMTARAKDGEPEEVLYEPEAASAAPCALRILARFAVVDGVHRDHAAAPGAAVGVSATALMLNELEPRRGAKEAVHVLSRVIGAQVYAYAEHAEQARTLASAGFAADAVIVVIGAGGEASDASRPRTLTAVVVTDAAELSGEKAEHKLLLAAAAATTAFGREWTDAEATEDAVATTWQGALNALASVVCS